MNTRADFQPTHVLQLHKLGTRVTIPVHAGGSFESVTPLFTYSEWSAGEPAAWAFDPKRTPPILLDGDVPSNQGWDCCELAPIELLKGGMQ